MYVILCLKQGKQNLSSVYYHVGICVKVYIEIVWQICINIPGRASFRVTPPYPLIVSFHVMVLYTQFLKNVSSCHGVML